MKMPFTVITVTNNTKYGLYKHFRGNIISIISDTDMDLE